MHSSVLPDACTHGCCCTNLTLLEFTPPPPPPPEHPYFPCLWCRAAIPDFQEFCRRVEDIFTLCKGRTEEPFAVSICTVGLLCLCDIWKVQNPPPPHMGALTNKNICGFRWPDIQHRQLSRQSCHLWDQQSADLRSGSRKFGPP